MAPRTRAGSLLTLAGAVAVVVFTLGPAPGDAGQELPAWCLLCGSRGLADAVLNFLLFLPLGAGLARLLGVPAAALLCLAASAGIELLQGYLPGRFPAVSDLVFNTLGGTVGALIAAHWTGLARLALFSSPFGRLSTFLAPALLMGATAALFQPQYPDHPYYGQWQHELGSLVPYPGRVLSVRMADLLLPDGRIQEVQRVRSALTRGDALVVEFAAGPPPARPSHLFALYDDQQREVLQWIVEADNLLLRRRTRSVDWKLDSPTLVWAGGFTPEEGDTVRLALAREGRRDCITVGETRRCDRAPGVESGWMLFHELVRPVFLRALMGWAWMLLLALPAGFAVGSRKRAILAGAWAGTLGWGISSWLPWLAPHASSLLGPALGAMVGGWWRERLDRRG